MSADIEKLLKETLARVKRGEITWVGLVVVTTDEENPLEVGHVGGPLTSAMLFSAIEWFTERTHETMLEAMEAQTIVLVGDDQN
jgi:hypothetical protein